MPSFLRISLLLSAALLAGCDKADESLVVCEPAAPGVASLAAFYQLYGPSVQVVQLNSAQAQTVRLLDGATIGVPAGAFAYGSGTPVTGPVELRAQLVSTPQQMVLSGRPSSTNWRPLEAGGHFRLTAWQGVQRLSLRPGAALTINVPQPTNASSTGQLSWRSLGVGGGGLANVWAQDTVPVGSVITGSGERQFRMRVWTDTLGWFSIGRLWTSNPADTTLLRANVEGDASTRVYLLPTQRSGAFLMKWNTQTRLMEVYGVPLGTELKVVALRYQNGQLKLSTQLATVRRGLVLRPAPGEVTPEQAAELIRQL